MGQARMENVIQEQVQLRVICDGRAFAMRVETTDGKLVTNVTEVKIHWTPDSSWKEGHPTATITLWNVPLDMVICNPTYVWMVPPATPDGGESP